ncbi:hypothetical protein TAGGR_1715 [Thermodesulfovibrio aggregans]|uniref:Uncharacterized protein n=1 Tax=Thermodesulfovibrio aggregans TaxID=86166 RepID=A0A0U9HN81_9BACT|nr:polysaccharide biosynthesis C-terminal domain-containing protein [Thermodesulfovibrio aggregans]GAQ94531.1 hypothetical protein TAGGR_1715 [Thermodesulfovibrio aggregans]
MIKSIFSTFTTRVFSLIISFATLILTTNYLGAEGRGYISLLTASAGLINLFSGFIGGAALVYLIPRNKSRNFVIQSAILSYFWAFFVSIVITAFLFLTHSVDKSIIFHVFLIGFLLSILSIHTVILLAFEKIIFQNLVNLLQLLVNFILFAILLLVFHKVELNSFIVSLYSGYIASLLMSIIPIIKNLPSKVENLSLKSSLKEILKYGFFAQLSNVIQYLNYRFSFFVLNYFSGVSAVGIYSVGVVISEAIWTICGSISLVQYSKIANSNDISYSQRITLMLAKLSFLATFIAVCLLILIPESLFSIILGKDFSSVKQIIILLSPGITIFGYSVIISHYFAGIGKYVINTKASFIGLIVTLIFNLTLVPLYGYSGAAISASLSYIATAFFLIYSFIRDTGIPPTKLLPSVDDLKFAVNKLKI